MARNAAPRLMFAGIALTLVSACSGGRSTPAAPAPAATRGTDGTVGARTMTLPVLEGFEIAVNRGTRTRTGVPGPRYWQQWADYKLSAELNPVSKRMTGSGTIT